MSEKRLIDANAFKRQAHIETVRQGLNVEKILLFCELIDMQPTIDAVEVVRCRDCCLGKPFKGRLMCHWMADEKGWGASATVPDHYCAWGKRKES